MDFVLHQRIKKYSSLWTNFLLFERSKNTWFIPGVSLSVTKIMKKIYPRKLPQKRQRRQRQQQQSSLSVMPLPLPLPLPPLPPPPRRPPIKKIIQNRRVRLRGIEGHRIIENILLNLERNHLGEMERALMSCPPRSIWLDEHQYFNRQQCSTMIRSIQSLFNARGNGNVSGGGGISSINNNSSSSNGGRHYPYLLATEFPIFSFKYECMAIVDAIYASGPESITIYEWKFCNSVEEFMNDDDDDGGDDDDDEMETTNTISTNPTSSNSNNIRFFSPPFNSLSICSLNYATIQLNIIRVLLEPFCKVDAMVCGIFNRNAELKQHVVPVIPIDETWLQTQCQKAQSRKRKAGWVL